MNKTLKYVAYAGGAYLLYKAINGAGKLTWGDLSGQALQKSIETQKLANKLAMGIK